MTRPRSRAARIAMVSAATVSAAMVSTAATVVLAGCGHGAPPSTAAPPSAATPAPATARASSAAPSQAASGKPFPLACARVDTSGSQASLVPASATSPVTLDDIGSSVGFPVASAMPDRSSNCDGCGYTFTALSGVGTSALQGTDATQDDTVAAVGGDVYVEISSPDLKESRLVRLARLVLTKVS